MVSNRKAFGIVFLAQMSGMFVSVLRSLILPIFLTVVNYGYFQSYLFYISLVPIITVGYNDGIYLRYGKYSMDELPVGRISSANWYFIISQLIICGVLIIGGLYVIEDKYIKFAFILSCSYGLFNSLSGLLLQVFQITQRFKEYAIYSVLPRIISTCLILCFIFAGYRDYKTIILCDFISFSLITVYMIIENRILFFQKFSRYKGLEEYRLAIEAGVPLLIAGMVGILMMGSGRLVVQIMGDIQEFAYYSFAISIASFISVAISSISTVLYPMISRMDGDALKNKYIVLNKYLKILIVAIFPFYYVICFGIEYVYPKYSPSLGYIGILLSMMYLHSLIYILQNTYYKVFRLERKLLFDNSITVIILLLLMFPIYYFTKSITLIAILTFIGTLLRYLISSFRLGKIIEENIINIREITILILVSSLTVMYEHNSYFLALCLILLMIGYCIMNIHQFKDIITHVFYNK